jgi:hypothetical protein
LSFPVIVLCWSFPALAVACHSLSLFFVGHFLPLLLPVIPCHCLNDKQKIMAGNDKHQTMTGNDEQQPMGRNDKQKTMTGNDRQQQWQEMTNNKQ